MRGGAERADDGLRVEALLHVRLQLPQELGGQQGDGGGAVAHLEGQGKEEAGRSDQDHGGGVISCSGLHRHKGYPRLGL